MSLFDAGVKDNVLPIKASAVVNFRIIPGDTVDSVMAYVTKVVDDPSVKIAPRGDSDDKAFGSNPSSVSPYDTESYERVARSIRQVSGEDDLLVAPYLVVGATDSRHYQGLSSNIYRFLFNRIGPDDVKRIHGTNERISVDNYEQTVRFYAQLMHNWSAP